MLGRLVAFLAALCGLRRRLLINGRALTVERKLADGGFSFVYLCVDAAGRRFAVKEILTQSQEQREGVRAEVAVHRALPCTPHIMPLHDVAYERLADGGERALLFFPYYARGSLQDRVNRSTAQPPTAPPFSERDVLALTIGMCRGLTALHELDPPLAHRDLCPRNVMVADDARTPVLIDFGSVRPARVKLGTRSEAMLLAEDASSHCSPPFRAPELWDPVTGGAINERSDGGWEGYEGMGWVWE